MDMRGGTVGRSNIWLEENCFSRLFNGHAANLLVPSGREGSWMGLCTSGSWTVEEPAAGAMESMACESTVQWSEFCWAGVNGVKTEGEKTKAKKIRKLERVLLEGEVESEEEFHSLARSLTPKREGSRERA